MKKRKDEADKIYYAIFRREIPEPLIDRFKGASAEIEARYSAHEVEKYHRIIRKVNDLEALEYAGRFRKKLPLLSDKFKAMVFLAESLPENYRLFINEEDNRLKGYLWLPVIGIVSLCKMVKGLFLLMLVRS